MGEWNAGPFAVATLNTYSVRFTSRHGQPSLPAGSSTSQSVILS